jgi:Zn-dependent protease
MVLIPVFTYLQLGWMMGYASVPYNADWGRRNPRRQALMSLAGPAANLLLALLAFALMRALLAAHVFEYAADISSGHYVQVAGGGSGRSPLGALALALGVMFKLNVILCIFNLLPIPPLDGSGVLSGLFPDSVGSLYDRMNQIPAFSILGMVMAWQLAPYIVAPVWGFALRLLYR